MCVMYPVHSLMLECMLSGINIRTYYNIGMGSTLVIIGFTINLGVTFLKCHN